MPDPTPGGEPGSGATSEALIFVSDASAEAERLTASLRTRGYITVDVPLGLLVGRVAVQRPSLVLCDADAPGALDAVERMREVQGGGTVDVLFLGEPGRTLDEQAERVVRQSSGIFVRPVDVYALLRKVESLIGPSSSRIGRPSTMPQASRVPVLVAATRRPYRYDTRARARNFPNLGQSAPPPATLTLSAREAPAPSAAPVEAGDLVPTQATGSLSSDLAALLGRAEQRVLGARLAAGAAERLSPEAELEAVLPEDLLAALDEPLDELDDEGDEDLGTPGTHGSDSNLGTRSGSRPGQDSTAGTSPGGTINPHAARDPNTTSGGDKSDSNEGAGNDAPPPTPPANPRSVPPSRTHGGADTTGFGTLPPAPSYGEAPARERDRDPPAQAPIEEEPASSRQISTKPPRGRDDVDPPPSMRQDPPPVIDIDIPNTLRIGDSIRVLARAVRARYSGAIAFEDDSGIRRVVLRDGDFVMAASGIEGESLVAFLAQRGDLSAEVAARVGRKLPQFGRHAGAALIAQGNLRQEDLWPALRSHAEWIITRIATLARGGASLEHTVPPRLAAEPSVFGGATGAEVLIEVVRRAVAPSDALAWLGGPRVQVASGEAETLLAECALSDFELSLVRGAPGTSLGELCERAQVQVPELSNVLFTLVELGILTVRSGGAVATGGRAPRRAPPTDVIDHEAVRARIRARRALVDEGDYFALLGVSRNATSYDIRRAYTTLRQEFDPGSILTVLTADLGEDVALVLEMLDEAYDILRDQVRRDRYRRALEDSPE
ncbi:MAG TPA: hypothetical protein VG937_05800 [Polyangiaceae bacterium]|nr:hypothetical protein [Polyangiaceae bacterium]